MNDFFEQLEFKQVVPEVVELTKLILEHRDLSSFPEMAAVALIARDLIGLNMYNPGVFSQEKGAKESILVSYQWLKKDIGSLIDVQKVFLKSKVPGFFNGFEDHYPAEVLSLARDLSLIGVDERLIKRVYHFGGALYFAGRFFNNINLSYNQLGSLIGVESSVLQIVSKKLKFNESVNDFLKAYIQ